MFLVQLAFRNLFRNVRRTIITSTAVVFGVAIQIIGWGLVDGLDENILRASAWTSTGDILLRPEGYPTDGLSWPLDLAAPLPAGLVPGEGTKVAARTMFQARLVNGAEGSNVIGISYDAATDPGVFPREHWSIDGAWPAPGALEVAVGDGLARLLKIQKGGSVVVEVRTAEGALNALTYTVTGLAHVDNAQMDNLGLWMERQAAADLVLIRDKYTHIALDVEGEPEAAKALLSAPGWSASTVREETADLLAVNTIRRAAILLLVFVIMLIAATGIANTTIMAAYERVREIGTLLAMGMPKRDVARMFLIEGAVMGMTAGLVGMVVGSAFVLYFQEKGFALPSEAMGAMKDLSVSAFIYTKFQWTSVGIALGFSFAVAVLASIFPARFAANLNPADAVRAD